MKKVLIFTVVIFAVFSTITFGQDKAPSYFEMDDYNRRNPETDTNIDLYMHSWKNSQQHIGHGGFIEQEILSPGDPLNPPKHGAVLKILKAYNHGILNAKSNTQPTIHEKEQVFFFVIKLWVIVDYV